MTLIDVMSNPATVLFWVVLIIIVPIILLNDRRKVDKELKSRYEERENGVKKLKEAEEEIEKIRAMSNICCLRKR